MTLIIVCLALTLADPLAPLPEASAPNPSAEKMVRRGQPVTLRLQQGTLTIATAGRALADGRKGDRIRVVALATRRTLDGVVEGQGEIRLVAP